ncbi:hypothetical protein Taro_001698 [Colocasia esculenta]|uniref:Uncharacterized protein n=1 Tax=Colocasia esculenta TaxID=4460 RepID=A0A843TGW0_COLES|nr:hypothetical protein [Colocasia esculenta]
MMGKLDLRMNQLQLLVRDDISLNDLQTDALSTSAIDSRWSCLHICTTRTAPSPPPPPPAVDCVARVASTSALLGLKPSPPPPTTAVHADDEASHHEGEGSYGEMMRVVWINEGNKIEPTQASQFITKSIQAHFPGPIDRFYDFLIDVHDLLYDMFMRNHRFTKHSDDLHARSAWTTTTRKGTDDYISEKAREVAESYSRGMDERYRDDSQHPELDPDIWVAAFGASKKGHMYGFGHSLGTTRVISFAAPGGSFSAAPTMTPTQFREIVNEIVSQNISHIVS